MNILRRTQIVLATSAAVFALAACGAKEDTTIGQQVDGAIEQTQQAAENTQQELQAAATDMQREGEAAVQAVSDSASDLAITAKVKAALAADDQLSAVGINVDTLNKVVSLQGPAPTREAAERATVLAEAVEGVSEVRNLLTVAGQS